MRVEVVGHGLRLSQAVRDYATRRVEFALGRFQDWIKWIRIRLADVNGPRGGVDKECLIQVSTGAKTIVVHDSGEDLHEAIDRAADRVGHAVSRDVERARDHTARPHPSAT